MCQGGPDDPALSGMSGSGPPSTRGPGPGLATVKAWNMSDTFVDWQKYSIESQSNILLYEIVSDRCRPR